MNKSPEEHHHQLPKSEKDQHGRVSKGGEHQNGEMYCQETEVNKTSNHQARARGEEDPRGACG